MPAHTDVDQVVGKSCISLSTQGSLTLQEAFGQCSTPAFQHVARSLEPKKLISFLDTLGLYKRIAATHPEQDPGQFWLKPNSGISLDEQIGLVKKLYFEKLPFQKRTQQLAKKLMTKETTSTFQLAYLSTVQQESPTSTTGWLVGWVEENQHPYFFALHTQSLSDRPELASVQVNLLKKILQSKGFLTGKK
ncbi:MAG: penicillin-binding transpeptidase domain-containing protein [Chitinophagaceae bacterium]